ncbi:hypothetical protein HID58_083195 [Brassica napus]|uniref:Flavin-containing monooxygenase n=1 Tax=Brassica napus TaxID=3708 RepID=A0ABQ7YCN2_BRANA|nr:hypothetical protein HID58_083195 [Brassica napus]
MASNHNTLTSSRVAIIGAGVSGLAAAKHLARHNPTVFEASDSVGGVWRSCAYGTTKLQSPRASYEFSDFLWHDRNNTAFPTYVEILDYLESYAKHFDLFKFIKFGSKVIEVRFNGEVEAPLMVGLGDYGNLLPGKPVWEVAVQTRDRNPEDIQWHAFEFVVICTGKYGDVPRIPMFPLKKGPKIFNGTVMHSMDYCKLEKEEASHLLRGKKVAVVGFKKSAIDLALESAIANQGEGGQACTMVVRTPHWVIPHYWIWGLPFFLFYSTRASQFIHDRPNQSFLRTLFYLLFSLLRTVVSKFIESYVMWKLPLKKYGLKPDHPFEEDYASCQMALVPDNFFEEADKGMIRATIHPLIPNMGFVGYVQSNWNVRTAELSSMWLSRLMDEKFKLPSKEKMLDQFFKEVEVMKRSSRFYTNHCFSTFIIQHADDLCNDMGLNPWRKSNFFHDVFCPYGSQDYRFHQEET